MPVVEVSPNQFVFVPSSALVGVAPGPTFQAAVSTFIQANNAPLFGTSQEATAFGSSPEQQAVQSITSQIQTLNQERGTIGVIPIDPGTGQAADPALQPSLDRLRELDTEIAGLEATLPAASQAALALEPESVPGVTGPRDRSGLGVTRALGEATPLLADVLTETLLAGGLPEQDVLSRVARGEDISDVASFITDPAGALTDVATAPPGGGGRAPTFEDPELVARRRSAPLLAALEELRMAQTPITRREAFTPFAQRGFGASGLAERGVSEALGEQEARFKQEQERIRSEQLGRALEERLAREEIAALRQAGRR